MPDQQQVSRKNVLCARIFISAMVANLRTLKVYGRKLDYLFAKVYSFIASFENFNIQKRH